MKDIHAHMRLRTHKEGRLRANKEADSIEGIRMRGKMQVKVLQKWSYGPMHM